MNQPIKTIIAAIMLTFVGAAAAQSPEGFTYKGFAFGGSKEEFAAKFPDWQCRASGCTFSWDECWGKAYRGGQDRDGCTSRNSFGGAPISWGSASFRDERLVLLYFTMSATRAKELMHAATQRYGAPVEVDDQTPFRTKAGGTFPNVKMKWHQQGATLTTWMLSGKLDQGAALVLTDEESERLSAEEKAKSQKGAKDF